MLSIPRGALRPFYDAAVIGSGYGGGVAASRLARMGLKVCVLERGREIPIGSFPTKLSEARRELQMTGRRGRIGPATGLFDIHLGHDLHVLMGCGLGGTSLINANVCLKPDPRVFDDATWPEEVHTDGLLSEGFARAERMLRPTPFAGGTVAKLEALKTAATALGAPLDRPPLHIAFSDGVNAAGVMQRACVSCGDCCSGCNVGAKTTTQLTYLPDAVFHGAEIFTEMPVRSVRKADGGGWQVALANEGDATRLISADIVVVAAGTLGSTEILLRSGVEGLALSPRLGERFSANADAIAIGYNNDVPVNGVGVGHPPKAPVGVVGPAVAGLIDLRATPALDDGIAIVEASIPGSMAPLLPVMLAGAPLIGIDSDKHLSDELDEAGRALSSLVNGAYRGAVHNTQTFLAIGHDEAAGRISLEDGRLTIHWPGAAKQAVYGAIENRFKRAVAATGGTYMPNPVSTQLMGSNLMTVHPLGGCAMGRDRESGVVNHKGEVFDATQAADAGAVHRGLYVCDGAVIPRSLGIHPLLTITALAERSMMHLAVTHGLSANDAHPQGGPRELYPQTQPLAVRTPGFITRLLRSLWP